MPIDLPAGYLTRPEAAKKFNRSQRALERDLDIALTIHDDELLSNWKLVTKDGQVRHGKDVTLELVKQLVTDGMTPAWCIAEPFLEQKYGLKGDSRPAGTVDGHSAFHTESARISDRDKTKTSKRTEPLPDDTAFLKEIIRSLEREKHQERERHDRIIAKLFGELDVKNKQISAWDEVTQGLTKALATGQITPNLGLLVSGTQPQNGNASQPSESAHPHNAQTKNVVNAATTDSTDLREEGSARSQKRPSRKRNKPAHAINRRSRVEKQTENDQPAEKHRWYETPTLKRLFSRRQ